MHPQALETSANEQVDAIIALHPRRGDDTADATFQLGICGITPAEQIVGSRDESDPQKCLDPILSSISK